MIRKFTPVHHADARAVMLRRRAILHPFLSLHAFGVVRGPVSSALVTCGGAAMTSAAPGTFCLHCVDAPMSGESVSRVDVFVVRIGAPGDGRSGTACAVAAARHATVASASAAGANCPDHAVVIAASPTWAMSPWRAAW